MSSMRNLHAPYTQNLRDFEEDGSQEYVDAAVQTAPRALLIVPSETISGPGGFSRKGSQKQTQAVR